MKYKVGDEVRITNDDRNGFRVGDIAKIAMICGGNYKAFIGNNYWLVNDTECEPYDMEALRNDLLWDIIIDLRSENTNQEAMDILRKGIEEYNKL